MGGNLLQEIALRMRGVYTPPVVCKYIENTQYKDQEGGWPLGLETDSHHDTCSQANNANKHANKAPRSLKDKAQEEKDKENTTCKEEAETHWVLENHRNKFIGSLFFTVSFTDAR